MTTNIDDTHGQGDSKPPTTDTSGRHWPIPPKQEPYAQALELGFDVLLADSPSGDKLASLGARLEPGCIRLPVLNREVIVNLNKREIIVAGGRRARVAWALLVLHYLSAEDVSLDTKDATLAYFSDSRGYLAVFGKRIVGRFLGTVGRTGEQFAQLSEQLGGTLVPSTGLCYRFDVLPRVPIAIVRHDGDEDFGPGASVIYRADIGHLLPAEDRVVAAELLLNALSGASIDEVVKEGCCDERRS
ncbi:MAG: DUF3786 domain-containing protein [Armatimonadota bacterium]